jgi:protein-disulfide isomerase
MERSLTIPIAIALGGIIVAGAVYISMPKFSSIGMGNSALVRPISTSDHILGNPTAPVIIVVYSDFECAFCKDFHETLLRIITNEGSTGNVALVYREFPLIEIHPNALSHAKAAECIAQVDGNIAFWKFVDALYRKQPVNPLQYGELASRIGISSNDFAICFAGELTTIETRIMADRKNALDMGANGTPYSLILVAGKPPVVMNGGYPYNAVKQLVDEALQSVKNP